MHAVPQPAVGDRGIVRVAGDEEHLEGRANPPRLLDKLRAVQPIRHANIRDQQIDPSVGSQNLQRRDPVGGFERVKADFPERDDDQLADRRLVVNHQGDFACVHTE